jgi:phosphatidylethanolamine-binding protein (PEBP) family uncharacterized protein
MRRPGENPVVYAIASVAGRLLRGSHAGPERSVLTLIPAPDTIAVTSTSFADGAEIPDVHAGAGRGGNRSPQLGWRGVPDGTAQLLLVMEDADVPGSRPVLHMVALLAPDAGPMPEGAFTADAPGIRYLRMNPLYGGGYHGPRALPNHGAHGDAFALFALGEAIPADAGIRSVDALVERVRGHVLARGVLRGTQLG